MAVHENDDLLPGGWKTTMRNGLRTRLSALAVAVAAAMTLGAFGGQEPTNSVLVQGPDTMTVAAAVRAVGGEVTHELGIINAVGARLTRQQLQRLEATHGSSRIHADRGATVAGVQRRGRNRRSSKDKESSKRERQKEWGRDTYLKGTKPTLLSRSRQRPPAPR